MPLFSMFTRSSGLKALAELDDRMLSDLGLCRHDLAQARAKGRGSKMFLNGRRSERAGSWLR